jgi:hypothetical protein
LAVRGQGVRECIAVDGATCAHARGPDVTMGVRSSRADLVSGRNELQHDRLPCD